MKHIFVIETDQLISEGTSEDYRFDGRPRSNSVQNKILHEIQHILEHEGIHNSFISSDVNQPATQVLSVPNALVGGGEIHLSVGTKSAVQIVRSKDAFLTIMGGPNAVQA